VLVFEFSQLGLGVTTVNVNNKNARERTGGNRDVEVRVTTPPLLDRVGVNGCALETVGCRTGNSFSR
jgi:hypothetical protein